YDEFEVRGTATTLSVDIHNGSFEKETRPRSVLRISVKVDGRSISWMDGQQLPPREWVHFQGSRCYRASLRTKRMSIWLYRPSTRAARWSKTENLSLDDAETVVVETDKTLYRADEPITALITSSLRDKMVVVDLARDSSVIRSERVQLHNGRGSIT